MGKRPSAQMLSCALFPQVGTETKPKATSLPFDGARLMCLTDECVVCDNSCKAIFIANK
jgi:hypothetical protein